MTDQRQADCEELERLRDEEQVLSHEQVDHYAERGHPLAPLTIEWALVARAALALAERLLKEWEMLWEVLRELHDALDVAHGVGALLITLPSYAHNLAEAHRKAKVVLAAQPPSGPQEGT